jgi:hypothetical protein
MTLTWYRNGGLNQILKRQTSRFHYGSKVPAVTITLFINKYITVPNSLCELKTTLNNIKLKWRKSIQFLCYFTEFGTAFTTVLPILFQYCYK